MCSTDLPTYVRLMYMYGQRQRFVQCVLNNLTSHGFQTELRTVRFGPVRFGNCTDRSVRLNCVALAAVCPNGKGRHSIPLQWPRLSHTEADSAATCVSGFRMLLSSGSERGLCGYSWSESTVLHSKCRSLSIRWSVSKISTTFSCRKDGVGLICFNSHLLIVMLSVKFIQFTGFL